MTTGFQALGKHYNREELIQQLGSTRPMAEIWKSGIERKANGCACFSVSFIDYSSPVKFDVPDARTHRRGESWAATILASAVCLCP